MLIAQAATAKGDAPSPPAGSGRRLDIEGLRAVAVLAVVFDHLLHWPQGGFIGVDIFFVISGYLITGILLREAQVTGKISFKKFYTRRIKRILPAAALVLAVTVAMAYVLYYAGRANSIAADAFWSLIFSANWRFAILGTDYMNSGASVSPLQHYWSLGVEEQFYIVWPWIILMGLFIAKKIRLNSRGTTLVLSAAIVVPLLLSFAYSLWETRVVHTVAYFSTFSRGWELAAGALLAVATANFSGFGLFAKTALHWVGLSIIAGSLVFIGPNAAFPGPYALFPVLGASLVILAGSGRYVEGYDKSAWLLTNAASTYIGKISYSLYLWHFPVIIYLAAFVPVGGRRFYLLAVIIMFALSIVSFKFVEDPIRRGTFGRRGVARSTTGGLRQTTVALTLFAVVVVAIPVGAYAAFGNKPQTSNGIAGGSSLASLPTGNTPEARTEMLASALSATEWPILSPNPAEMGPDGALAKPNEWIKDGCLGGELSPLAHDRDVIANAERCVYGNDDAPKSMIIFGDSTTMSFVPGIRKSLEGQNWKVYVYTVAACSPTLVVPKESDGSAEECVQFKAWVVNQIQQLSPTMVVSSFLRNDGQLTDHTQGANADAQWQSQVTGMGKIVREAGAEYVLLGAPNPAKSDPSQCISRVSKPADCITSLPVGFDANESAMKRAIADIGPGALYVSTTGWFCVEDRCPAFVGNTGMFADINHISARASEELAPLMAEAFGSRVKQP